MLYIFDMGGVVTSTSNENAIIAKTLGLEQSEFDSYTNDLFLQYSDGMINSREFWMAFSARSGIPVHTDFFHLFFHPKLNLETVKLINLLKDKGNRVVCGTNTIDSHYFNHLERGDYAFFDQTYASFQMGVSKPNPKFWELILLSENEKAENTIFTDDKLENCQAAAQLGIKSIHFKDISTLCAELK